MWHLGDGSARTKRASRTCIVSRADMVLSPARPLPLTAGLLCSVSNVRSHPGHFCLTLTALKASNETYFDSYRLESAIQDGWCVREKQSVIGTNLSESIAVVGAIAWHN